MGHPLKLWEIKVCPTISLWEAEHPTKATENLLLVQNLAAPYSLLDYLLTHNKKVDGLLIYCQVPYGLS